MSEIWQDVQYYFLVSQSDTQKMIKLDYKMIEEKVVCSLNNCQVIK